MIKHEFTVPVELIEEFSEVLVEKDLLNEVIGTTDEKEIIIEVKYDKDNKKDKHAVYKLHEMIDEFNGEAEEEEEEDNDDK